MKNSGPLPVTSSAASAPDQTGYVPIYSTGPTGLYLSYADAGDFKKRRSLPCMFWLARTYQNSHFSDSEHTLIKADNVDPFHMIQSTFASVASVS